MGGTGHRQLERLQAGATLLGNQRLKRLGRRSEEEWAIDVPTRGQKGPIWRDDGNRALVRGLDKPGSDLLGEQRQPLTGASSCWLRYLETTSSWRVSITW